MEKSTPSLAPVTLISGYRGLAATLIPTFRSEGHRLSVLVRNPEAAQALAREMPEAHIQMGDVGSRTTCERWVADAWARFGRIDHLINNAAVTGPPGRLHEINFNELEQAMEINLMAPAYLCHLLLKRWEESGMAGVLINLSGGGATTPRPNFTSYTISKCALVRLTETLAAEYPHHRCYAISPGALNTPLLEAVLKMDPVKVGKEYDEAKRRAETGGEDPAKAAELMRWLCATRPPHLNGRVISAIWDDYRNFPTEAPQGWWTLRRVDEVCRKNLSNTR